MDIIYSEVYETPILYFIIFDLNKQKFIDYEEYSENYKNTDEYKHNNLLKFSYELTKEVIEN